VTGPITPRIAAPEISVVIPVYNESKILRESVEQLCTQMHERGWSFEIVLAENGSKDDTVTIAAQLCHERDELGVFSHPEPNYGGALRSGIRRARGRFVI
jgi:glycosyltransferase involved in cell wall biosynthesis